MPKKQRDKKKSARAPELSLEEVKALQDAVGVLRHEYFKTSAQVVQGLLARLGHDPEPDW